MERWFLRLCAIPWLSAGFALCLGLCFGMASTIAQAVVEPVPETSFEALARVTYSKTSAAASTADQAAVIHALGRSGLVDLSKPFGGWLKALRMDQYFASADFSRMVFIKYDLRPRDTTKIGVFFQDSDGSVVFHGRTRGGASFAVLTYGVRGRELNQMVLDLTESRPTKTSWLLRLNLPNAEAMPFCEDKPPGAQLSALAKAVYDRGLTCVAEIGLKAFDVGESAVWAVTGGLIDGSTWRNVAAAAATIKALSSGFLDKMSGLYQGFFRLEPERQAKLFCRFVGEFLGSVATIAVAGGAVGAIAGGAGSAAAVGAASTSTELTVAGAATTAQFFTKARTLAMGGAALDATIAHMENNREAQEELSSIRCRPPQAADDPPAKTPKKKSPVSHSHRTSR